MAIKTNAVELFEKVLTPEKRKEAFALYEKTPVHQRNEKLCTILAPVMPEIDRILGQPNELRYFAYLLEHTFNMAGEF